MPAFPAEFGMPVRVDLVSSAPRKSERFYRELMGWEYSAAGEGGGRRMAKLMGMPVSALFAAELDAEIARYWDELCMLELAPEQITGKQCIELVGQ